MAPRAIETGASARSRSLPRRAETQKLKASDLPLTSAVRNSIDGLVHTFKKQGNYDEVRKQVLHDFTQSGFHDQLENSIIEALEEFTSQNDYLLKMDSNKAAQLFEGILKRTGIYEPSKANIHKLLDGHSAEIEKTLRTIRAREIGEEAAFKEQQAGSKTDQEYAEEVALKRAIREAERRRKKDEEREAVKRQMEISKAKLAEQRRNFKESQLAREERLAKLRVADDQQHQERRKSRFDQRKSPIVKDMPTRDLEPPTDGLSTKDPLSNKDPLFSEVKIDDDIALRAILTDTKEPGHKSRHQPQLEIDETLLPPPRKPKHISAINTNARDSPIRSTEVKKELKNEATADGIAPILNAPKGPKADIRISLGKSLVVGDKKRERSRSPAHHASLSKDRDPTKRDDVRGTERRRESRWDVKEIRRGETTREDRLHTPRETDRGDRYKRDHRNEEYRSSRKHSRSPSPVHRSTRRRERSPTPVHHPAPKDSRSKTRSRSRNRDREHRSSHRSRSRESAQYRPDYRRNRSPPRIRENARRSLLVNRTDRDVESKKYMEERARLQQGPKPSELQPVADDHTVVEENDTKESDAQEISPKTSPRTSRKRDGSKDRSTKREGRSRSRSPEMPPPSARRESHAGSVDVPGDKCKPRDSDSKTNHNEESEVRPPSRRPESVRSGRSRERTPPRRISRVGRSSSPPNIDRYVPGGGTSRRDKRDRDRDRSRDRDRRDSHKSGDRNRERRDRSRDRRYRSRDRDRHDRSRDRVRERSRSRDRERERDRDRVRERNRDSKRRRSRTRSRSRSREKRREKSKDRGDRNRRRD